MSAQDPQPENEESLNLQLMDMRIYLILTNPWPKGLVEGILLLGKVLYLERKGGGILSPSRRCNRVLGYFEEDIFLLHALEIEEPTSYVEALGSPHHKEWMEAMRDEMDSICLLYTSPSPRD